MLSLALNLFFILGAVWIRLHPPASAWNQEQRYQRMAAELDLDGQQRNRFEQYVAAMRSHTAIMHEQVRPLIASAWQAMDQPQADAAQISQLFDQAAEKRRAFQREATSETLAFLTVLSPAQRAKFVTLVREHQLPWRGAHSTHP